MIWIEADGHAMAEVPVHEGGPSEVRVAMVKEGPIVGRVVGPEERPIPGATVRGWFNHADFRVPRPDPPPPDDHHGFPIEILTDADGRFAFRGLPPWMAITWYEVRHPDSRTKEGHRPPLKAGAPNTFAMELGCKVAGIVVDEQGRPIRGADVQIRRPGSLGSAFSTWTAEDGRFRFGGVDPGRWMVVVQPERQAPTSGLIVATRERPVENQYVAGPASYISGKVVGADGRPIARAAVGWAVPVDERGELVEGLGLDRMTSTAEDGTFRLGPLSTGEYRLTGLVSEPRREGRARARSNQTNVVIRVEPDRRR